MAASKRIQITAEKLLAWTQVVPIEQLRQHPRNPNLGEVERIQDSVRAHGLFRSIVVSADYYILAGNHTYQAALGEGKTVMVCHVLPLAHDDPQALEILVADNEAHKGSKTDETGLLEILSDINSARGNLEGALWDAGRYQRLADLLAREADRDPLEDKPAPAAAGGTPDFAPASAAEQGKLDAKKPVTCPECGHEFHPSR